MNIFIVRHGQSAMNIGKHDSSCADYAIPLTKLGEKQAFDSGNFLNEYMINNRLDFDKTLVLVSPYTRAYNTFTEMNKSLEIDNDKIVEEDLIIEQLFGLFCSITDRSTLPDIHPYEFGKYQNTIRTNGAFFTPRPYGESAFDVVKRANIFLMKLNNIIEKKEYENIIIVSHHNFIRYFLKVYLNKSLDWYYKENGPDNCSIQLIKDGDYKGYIYGTSYEKWID